MTLILALRPSLAVSGERNIAATPVQIISRSVLRPSLAASGERNGAAARCRPGTPG